MRTPKFPPPFRPLDPFWALVGISVLFSVLLALGLCPTSARAHGCEGQASCNSGVLDQSTQHQQQHQQQHQGQAASVHNNSQQANRYLSVRPVQVAPAVVVSPASDVSRYADGQCGPRMVVESLAIRGLNNRPLGTQAFEAGYDQYLKPADEPYRRVDVAPGLYQLLGHRVIETSAVVTVSTSMGFAVGGFGTHGGGSGGASSGGAIQRLANTIRLVECVAYEVDTRPATAVLGIRG